MVAPPTDALLYPSIEPYDAGWLATGDGQRLHYEQCGRPDGAPVLFLHGGPGSGASARHRRLFDPARCRSVLFDQRGCGRSEPRGETCANTSDHLLADIERLRAHLDIARWLVVGGSWGAGLGLAYAAAHPDACAGLILRATFLGRPEDIDWFFLAAQGLQPAAWEALRPHIPAGAPDHPLSALHAGLFGRDPATALRCALAWQAWEAALDGQAPGAPPDAAGAAALIDKYRVQSHYLVHGCFWGERPLLRRAATLPTTLPVTLMHGTQDAICRPQATQALHARLPRAVVRLVPGGHSPFTPAMVRALDEAVQAMTAPTPVEHAP